MSSIPSEKEIDSAFQAKDVAGLLRMLDGGLDPNWTNASGDTLLHGAAKLGDLGLVEKLLEKGATARAYNRETETPWDIAVSWGNDDAAKILRKHIADETLTRGNDPIAFQSLADIRATAEETGVSPLHEIARRGQLNQLLALKDAQDLSAGDLLVRNLDGDTVLLNICQHGQLPLLAKTELWMKRPQDFQQLWTHVPAHYKKEVDYDAFIAALRQAKLQSYGKPKLKGFQK